MGLLIPVLFVTCPATRDSDSAAPVSTPEARALGKVSKGPSEPRGLPHPPLLPTSLRPLCLTLSHKFTPIASTFVKCKHSADPTNIASYSPEFSLRVKNVTEVRTRSRKGSEGGRQTGWLLAGLPGLEPWGVRWGFPMEASGPVTAWECLGALASRPTGGGLFHSYKRSPLQSSALREERWL